MYPALPAVGAAGALPVAPHRDDPPSVLAALLPTGYDYATGLTTSGMQRLSLSPTGREVDAELSYGTRLGAGWIGGNLFARRQPGHDAEAAPDIGAAIRTSFSF